VLLVSYTFPPQYDVSARRAAKLCKYLPAEGWRPVVLTRDWTTGITAEDRAAYAITSHPAALGELHGVTIVRTSYRARDHVLRRAHERLGGAYAGRSGPQSDAGRRMPERWTPRALARRGLSLIAPTFGDFPDAFRGWVDEAVRVGVEVVRRESIDAICSICPPATAHVVASELARRTGLPWIAQFDDLFSFRLERERRAAWRWYGARAHRRWMRGAAAVGAITPGMLDYLRRTYRLDGDVVMVGFDPADSPVVERRRRDRMQIVYTGSVYLDDQRPELLFDAVERVLSARPPGERCVELVFAGTRHDAELRARVAAFPAAARACTFVERLTPEATLALQREADALVLFNYTAAVPEGGTLSFPAKAFEYLAARRPILALPRDPGGWGDELLRSTGAGVAVDSAADAAAVLDGWLQAWQAGGDVPYSGDAAAIARYGQPRQAAILDGLLNQAVARGA
jgi:hypothetical protein